MDIVFATHNRHKSEEACQILGPRWTLRDLHDLGQTEEIPETADTLQGNALQKAQFVYDKYHLSCFADDTGLEVEALGGEPGIFSARYAGGEGHDSEANMRKLLAKLEHEDNRRARFRTVIALLRGGSLHTFEGIVEGVITREKSGAEGFGYDPIFRPDGYDQTFAELGADVKNKISHRARATEKLACFLQQGAS